MALNLNKGNNGENSSKPSNEKKGLNLSKSEDSLKPKINLSKENVVSNTGSTDKDTNTILTKKKRKPVLFIVVATVLIGGGIFWFKNKNNINKNDSEPALSAEVPAPEQPLTNSTPVQQGNQNANVEANNGKSGEGKTIPAEIIESPPVGSINNSVNSNEVSTSVTNQTTNKIVASSTASSGSIEEKARQVIKGAFGNGSDRKRALGNEYAAIQAKVNEILK